MTSEGESNVEGDFLQAVVDSPSEETDENTDLDRRVEPVSQEICPPPKKKIPPGPNFVGNLPPPRSSEIWPPSETWILKLNKKCNAV